MRTFKNTNQSHSCGAADTIDTIDGYIAGQPEEIQPVLLEIRRVIREAAPGAAEKISWGMPTFWQGENLIHFAAFKKHIGIYPGDLANLPFEGRLEGYQRSKGAIQLPLGKPIDYGLIADITRWRVERVEGKGKDKLPG